MTAYIGRVLKEDETDFGVDFPDFPGCITAGKSLDEALRLAEEALDLHIRGMVEDGEHLPQPTPLDAVVLGGAVPVLVRTTYRPKGKAVRANITVEEGLLHEIDAYASSRSMTRSAFLADAARIAMRA